MLETTKHEIVDPVKHLIPELENISDILFDNGYGSWGNALRKAMNLLEELQEQRDKAYRHAASLAANAAVQPEVGRCKDCENFVWNSISQNAGSCGLGIGDGKSNWHSKDWFCANWEKKDGERDL